LVTNVILARSLGPEGRGVYAVAVMVPAIIALLAQLGVGSANVYYLSKRLIELDELIGHSLSLAFLLGTLCFLFVFAYVRLTHSSQFLGIGSDYVLVSCLGLPFVLLTGFLMSILQGGQRFLQFNVVLLLQYAAPTVALVVAVILLHRGTMGAVAAWTASAVVSAVAAAYFVAPPSRLSFRLHPSTVRPLLRFGLISYLGSLTSFVNYRFDVFIVNLFAGARQVGLYSVGTGLAEVVWYLANAAGIVLAPRVASADGEEADRITEAVSRVVGFLALAAAIVVAVLAPFVVVLFFGADFAESKWAVWLLLPGIVTFSVGRVLSMYLLGRNRLKIDLLASFVGLVATLALDLLLIPHFGFRGAAIASSIAYTAAMLVDLVWVVRNSSISLGRLLVARPADAVLLWNRMKQMRSLIRRPLA
jgi:O-antigen/teichoic acid export membrane protein